MNSFGSEWLSNFSSESAFLLVDIPFRNRQAGNFIRSHPLLDPRQSLSEDQEERKNHYFYSFIEKSFQIQDPYNPVLTHLLPALSHFYSFGHYDVILHCQTAGLYFLYYISFTKALQAFFLLLKIGLMNFCYCRAITLRYRSQLYF